MFHLILFFERQKPGFGSKPGFSHHFSWTKQSDKYPPVKYTSEISDYYMFRIAPTFRTLSQQWISQGGAAVGISVAF
jgi:hypothetical protein